MEQKMTLYEFMMKRLSDLGLKKADLVNRYDLEWSTLSKIKNNHSIREETKQKLARALQCTQGDIQEALANTPHPLRKEAEQPEGQAGKMIEAKKHSPSETAFKKKLEEVVADPEEEEDVMFPEEKEESFPAYQSSWAVDRIAGRREYASELKDLLVEVMAQVRIGEDLSADVFADFGKAVIDKLNEELKE